MATRSEILRAIALLADVAAESDTDAQSTAMHFIRALSEMPTVEPDGCDGPEDSDPDFAEADEPQPGYTPDLPDPWYRSQDGLAYFNPHNGLQIVWEPDMARWQVEFPGDRMRRGRFDDPRVAAGWADVEFARMVMERERG